MYFLTEKVKKKRMSFRRYGIFGEPEDAVTAKAHSVFLDFFHKKIHNCHAIYQYVYSLLLFDHGTNDH